jgi:glycine/D-amino acid oxidase-like deaminating enzyme
MVTQQTGRAFTTDLARQSVQMYRQYSQEGWDIDFVTCGYTTFASDASSTSHITDSAEALAAAGVEHRLTAGGDAVAAVKAAAGAFMKVAADAHAAVTVPSDGFVDARKLVTAFLHRAGSDVLRVCSPAEAVEILVEADDRVVGVRLASGDVIACTTVVNCAGAWAPLIAAQVGLHLPIRRSRRQMAILRTDPPWELHGIIEHLSHSDGEWYFRPSADGSVLVGTGSLRWLEESTPFEQQPAPDEDVNQTVAHYLGRNTLATEIRVLRQWAGDRPITFPDPIDNEGDALESGGTTIETRDWFPMVGSHPTIAGYVDSCGWGEFGVTLAPIGGAIVCAVVNEGALPARYEPLSHTRFSGR